MMALSRGRRSSPFSRSHASLGFNESSSTELADVTLEVNGLFGAAGIAFKDALPAVLQHLCATPGWDELRVNALSLEQAAALQASALRLGLLAHEFKRSQTYWIDLDAINAQARPDYLASRSANTRQQLRRALKSLKAAHGALQLECSANLAQAHEWLDRLAALHRRRWDTQHESKGFAKPAFARFHHDLLNEFHACGRIEILRASAAGHDLAYLYNFVAQRRVYFNMCGVEHATMAAFKPGLLAHWQAIEHYRKRGMGIYDFGVGSNRYKNSLCTHQDSQIGMVVRRPLLKFKLEDAARRIKRRLAQWRMESQA
jgi:CelD/BcsL family acetyltransferase involved in cellulose biosynthesis